MHNDLQTLSIPTLRAPSIRNARPLHAALPLARRLVTWPLLVALLVAALPLAAGVQRCQDEQGHLTYTQFACPHGSARVESRPGSGTVSLIRTPALSEAETRALSGLETRLARERAARAQQRRQLASRYQARRSKARLLCDEAREGLEALAAERRKGYRAADARTLDARELELERARRQNC